LLLIRQALSAMETIVFKHLLHFPRAWRLVGLHGYGKLIGFLC